MLNVRMNMAAAGAITEGGGGDEIFSSWYLPSIGELRLMYSELHQNELGGFSISGYGVYLSSNEVNATQCLVKAFGIEMPGVEAPFAKDGEGFPFGLKVRACRSFISETVYAVGDIGPGGGCVFYKDGNDYIEAAIEDQSESHIWSTIADQLVFDSEIGNGEDVFDGLLNTEMIIAQVIEVPASLVTAAQQCLEYELNGKTDWYLPSQGECQLMGDNLIVDEIVYNDWYLPSLAELLECYANYNFSFGPLEYWSSNEDADPDYAIVVRVDIGSSYPVIKTNGNMYVKPVRAFTSITHEFNYGDTGPGGGFIFYKDGNNYKEFAPNSYSNQATWTEAITDCSAYETIGPLYAGFSLGTAYWTSNEVAEDGVYASPDSHAVSVQFLWHTNTVSFSTYEKNYDGLYVRPIRSFTSSSPSYNVGDLGPGNGIIFNVDGDDYLEVGPVDILANRWSGIIDSIIGTTGIEIGDGLNNTNAIVDQVWTKFSAAQRCLDLVSGGKDDWFMPSLGELGLVYDTFPKTEDWYVPSKDELNLIYTELVLYSLGAFSTFYTYWSSSETSYNGAWQQSFTDGSQDPRNKADTLFVIGIRSFTSVSPSYAVRDIGPSGGYIIYKDGNNYIEAGVGSQGIFVGTTKSWSSLPEDEVGTTSTAIGEGKNNTDEIIAAGDTSGAAYTIDAVSTPKLLYDLLWSNYHSSSEVNFETVSSFNMADGSHYDYVGKNYDTYGLRAIRSFASVSPSYTVGDIGPGGGWVFYKNGDDYLEICSTDISMYAKWGNILEEIGTTSTNVGEGLNNSNEIAAQEPEEVIVDSAAKLCHDYTV